MLYKEYLSNVQNLVAKVADTQSEKIEKAAESKNDATGGFEPPTARL